MSLSNRESSPARFRGGSQLPSLHGHTCVSAVGAYRSRTSCSCGLLRGLRTRRHTRFKIRLRWNRNYPDRSRIGHRPAVSQIFSSPMLLPDAQHVDLAITCPVASAHLTVAARRRGAAASALRRVKERRYAEGVVSLPRAEGCSHRFQRFIVDSFGDVEKVGLEWLRKCFAEHRVEYLELLRRLSVSLRRYSSSMLAEARHRRLGLHASLPSS
ncbi:hypothetical protein NDN08_000222 [Rhodosorus marinus]|uniref:Uncharacterized protein n=1 Tax=Rhodosorus marinus TaxID=101924 RepID=A0AAV8UFZ1_9RHOD|nr:hypothetical protein NDN08_000222 [Rhodosorus marinus]